MRRPEFRGEACARTSLVLPAAVLFLALGAEACAARRVPAGEEIESSLRALETGSKEGGE